MFSPGIAFASESSIIIQSDVDQPPAVIQSDVDPTSSSPTLPDSVNPDLESEEEFGDDIMDSFYKEKPVVKRGIIGRSVRRIGGMVGHVKNEALKFADEQPVPAVGVVGFTASGLLYVRGYRKSAFEASEKKRLEQFKTIMGGSNAKAPKWGDSLEKTGRDDEAIDVDSDASSIFSEDDYEEVVIKPSLFKIRKNKNARSTDIHALITDDGTPEHDFNAALTGYLTFGAPGRFGELEKVLGIEGTTFDLTMARTHLTSLKLPTDLQSAEAFASVVNCLIIDIVDLASSTLKEKEEVVMKGLDVVLDFMEFASEMYESVAGSTVIKPVVYQGTLGRGKLEQMYKTYLSGSNIIEADQSHQDRVDQLQQVFSIKDAKANGIQQKIMMKSLMKMMKGEGGEGMEGFADMMKEMGGVPEGVDVEKMMKMANRDEKNPPTPEEVSLDF
ncbi:hypothetical protein TL16_g04533 [Triparma laevis f. inornata]|uniref:Uncharacterized protein n=1 Tax=Triparma laevis f. inornata TaxID=1714386 RepID=A0A9W7A6Y6_9STRA|nr:hypothetical protein TL16_g04533 [Triparma laevis f. inornata]